MDAPTLDRRSADEILAQALALAATYVPGWSGPPIPGSANDPGDPAFQLVRAFSRLMEILIERLNKVPDKNFLAFLDMVGVEASPGAPAAVPVTFLPSPKAPQGGLVPQGTQAATTQTDKADAQVFETRQAIYVTASKLVAIVNLLPQSDRYWVFAPPVLPPKPDPTSGAVLPPPSLALSEGAPGLSDVPHVLYLGSNALFGRKELLDVTLTLKVKSGNAALLSASNLVWRKLDKNTKNWQTLSPAYSLDLTGNLKVVFGSFGNAEKSVVAGIEDVWISCTFVGTLPPPSAPLELDSITGALAPAGAAISASEAAQRAFAGATPIDLSRPFKPFGDRPRFGDAFYLSSRQAFSAEADTIHVNASIKPYLTTTLQQIFGGLSAENALLVAVHTAVAWQYLTSDGTWKPLVTFHHHLTATASTPPPPPTITRVTSSSPASPAGEDGTFFGAADASSATFSFQRPADMASGKVNGEEGFWIRALLTSDDPYGREAFLVPGPALTVVQSTLIPPVVMNLTLSFTYKSAASAVEHIVTDNNFALKDHAPGGAAPVYPLRPFTALPEVSLPGSGVPAFGSDGALYAGFDQPFSDVFISLYVKLRDIFPSVDQPAEQGRPRVTWEYLGADSRWKPLDVQDDTSDLTSSGTVSFLGPSDMRAEALFGPPAVPGSRALYWLRARLAGGFYDYAPALQGIFPNTVMADNRQTFRGDVIAGSGSGEPKQRITLLKAPVLSAELWVREPEPPPQAELAELFAELRGDPRAHDAGSPLETSGDILEIRTPAVPAGSNVANPLPSREVWVRWRRVPNFLGSGPRSRHYALDPLLGVLELGDGKLQGMLPPVAKDNLVIRNYRTGGGEAAARVALPLAVKELKSSLPYVEKVFNVEAATGGSNPWDLRKIFEFGPQLLKNKGRAVSAEDFEWMVLQQFSQVARAKCLSTRAPGPGGLVMKPGAVTLVVVPRSSTREPRPSSALLKQIADFLADQCLGSIVAEVHALGPGFYPIAVDARVRAREPGESSEVERRAVRALEDFFHPLTGGEQGTGWPFGRDVQVSEVFAVLQRVEGVDYVESVSLSRGKGGEPIGKNDLLSSGSHAIEMS
jgi:hypothetical protein